MSLDGVMQAPGGPNEDPTRGFQCGGWIVPHVDEMFGRAVDAMFEGPFDLLLGRRTYEIFAAHWPYVDAEDDAIAERFDSVTKYVATRQNIPLEWKKSVALNDAAVDVARLKKEKGPTLLTQGSAELIQTLLKNDLIDEIKLFTFPVVLGGGKKLFADGAKPRAFKLVENQCTSTGVMIARYERAGALKTGDYSLDPPTAAERERRERLSLEV